MSRNKDCNVRRNGCNNRINCICNCNYDLKLWLQQFTLWRKEYNFYAKIIHNSVWHFLTLRPFCYPFNPVCILIYEHLIDLAQVLPWTCYVNIVLCGCSMWNCVYVYIICLKIFMFSQYIFHHMDSNPTCCNDGHFLKFKGTLRFDYWVAPSGVFNGLYFNWEEKNSDFSYLLIPLSLFYYH